MNFSKKTKLILVFIGSYIFFFTIFKVEEIKGIGAGRGPIMQNFILPFIFSLILGSIISLIIAISVKQLKSLRTISVVISIGILLTLLAFLSPQVTGVGGAFDEATGRNDIPNGIPLSFLKPTYLPGAPPPGWSPPLKFHPIPFVVDIAFWIVFAMMIVFSKKMYCKRKRQPLSKTN